MGKLGLQLYSVRDATGDNLLTTIRNASEMGYEGTQFAGFFDYPAKEVKAELAAAGIITAGAHVGIDQLVNNLDEVMRFHEVIDNDLIICPSLPENMRTKPDDYYRTAEILNGIGRKLKGAGFRFGYHNHAFEFEADEGKTGFDILYEQEDFTKDPMESAKENAEALRKIIG
ncbi:hypothetical protein CIL03_11915 [Virgibacillus indicus]|uniref:Xylose isomerase n=1 Tax=Virgibacillus indicus TaxID=2024554 RepID=A0A265NA70_9BACI|nr:hypothetical protein [Virgibacillus indicus]OZU88349.1 hypothetical protein CIL03_11915 [Virgibacillus indicus]